MHRRKFISSSLAVTAAASLGAPALAQSLGGKTVTILIPFGVGGGGDLWGRFISEFLAKYLPGKPTVVIKNSPGGGSVSGANLYMATAKPDGLMVLVSSGSTQFPYLLGESHVKYDYRKLKTFVAGPTGGVAYITTKLGVNSLQDLAKLKGKKLHFPSQGVTSLDLVPLLAFRLLGLDVDHIVGFPGRGEGRLGFERGEFELDYQTTSAYLRSSLPIVKRGDAFPICSWGLIDKEGKLVRDPNFPDIPTIREAYVAVHGKEPSGIEWEAFLAFLISGFPAQKQMLVPIATPEPIVEMFRSAIRKMRDDPDYKARRDDMIGEYEQVTDGEAETLYTQATTLSPEARDYVRSLLSKDYRAVFN